MAGYRRWMSVACWAVLALPQLANAADSKEAQWIWLNNKSAGATAGQTAFFRKQINLRTEAAGNIEITADDEYELFVNGRKVGSGSQGRDVGKFEITKHLAVGKNVIAVRVANRIGNSAGLAARVNIQAGQDSQWFSFNTDPSWKVYGQNVATWNTLLFNDSTWGSAKSLGTWGDKTPSEQAVAMPSPAPSSPSSSSVPKPGPASEETPIANATKTERELVSSDSGERFQIQRGFSVQRLLNHDAVGSVIAMAFNEFGHLLVAKENGPLLLIFDKDEDGVFDDVRTYCEDVKSCQGILPLNGEVYVTGQGPQGVGMYRLRDEDRNGTLENVKKMVSFKGQFGEHGPHGLSLGPDGMIYIMVGNHTQVVGPTGSGETLVDSYEGDLVPRYEDPGGHARGIKAPGGTVVRVNLDGSVVEKVAGGIRNAYDLTFHPDGGLFVHDSDMESDAETAWFRSTAIFDITEGGEYGWRSGWATWPDYYIDRLPSLLDTGRGSPTGATCYEHFKFPVRYHNALFLADWSEGRILAMRVKPNGAGFDVESETFLQGKPLNVCDLAVGPDGALYFCTGGRGTAGGIFRVVWDGETPERMSNLGTGIARAIRQPQLSSAWGRQEVAGLKKSLGSDWAELVAGVAYSNENPPHYRTRAMDLMQLFGPVPSEDLLIELSQSPSEAVRAKSAYLMGLHPGARSAKQLATLLKDTDPHVQRAACEAILRSQQWPKDVDDVIALLGHRDRTLTFVARRLLERLPMNSWKEQVLSSSDNQTRLLGALAMINVDHSEPMAIEVLAECSELMTGFLTDAQFVDTLRVCQVTLHRSQIARDKVTVLRDQIAEEFPAGNPRVNQELIKLAAYLDADAVAPRALKFIHSEAPKADRIAVAMYLQFFSHDWTAAQRFEILKFFEAISLESEGGALPLYIMAATKDFAETFTSEDAMAILDQGTNWPNAALAAIYRLPRPLDETTAVKLRALDRKILDNDLNSDIYKRLRTGIVAMLATATDEESQAYLREIWRKDPERREIVALGLAQHPDGENWDYLVRSLNILEGESAIEVVSQLKTVAVATDDPSALRQLILLGLRAEKDHRSTGPIDALLRHWTGVAPPSGMKVNMAFWQDWYAKTYHDRPAPFETDSDASKWDLDELVKYIESESGRFGDPVAGKQVYQTAQCASCHRFGGFGDSVGPELTSVSKRFTRREVLESILYPSHVISDQYMSKKVLMLDGRVFVGIVSDAGGGFLSVRDSKNQLTQLDQSKVDQVLPNNSSVMPSGLLDPLTLQQISDLLAYMNVLAPIEVARRP